MKDYNKKLSTTPNASINSQDIKNKTRNAPQLHTLSNNYPLFLVPRNYRNIALTEHISTNHGYPQSPVTHISLSHHLTI